MVGYLFSLGKKYGTDKAEMHQYTRHYEEMFKGRRSKVRKVLEIGIWKGGSLRMWKDFFPKATIYGIDTCEDYLFKEPRIKCFLCDAGNKEELKKLPLGKDFDLIVDDGSHKYNEQMAAFDVLYPLVKEGGIYVIEDVEKEYPMGRMIVEKQGNLIVID